MASNTLPGAAFDWLPAELIWSILRFATPTAIDIPSDGSPPFLQKPGPMMNPADLGLHDKVNIVLVCRSWRSIAVEFLYEDLVVSFDTVGDLLQLLRTSASEDPSTGYGRYVRCIRTRRSSVEWRFCQIVDFFLYCPNIRILCKADALAPDGQFWSPGTSFTLSDITRVSLQIASVSLTAIFWGDGSADLRIGADRFQYIFLLYLLELCPNVDFLSISANPQSLHDLRRAVEHNRLAGKNIRYLELQPLSRTWTTDFVHYELLMTFFPGVKEISHHVGRPAIVPTIAVNNNVATFRLHLTKLVPPSENTLRAATPELMALAGSAYPALQRVVLHGDWSSVANIHEFQTAEKSILDSGRQLVFADGQPVQRRRIDI
ncbi:hypothetical protein B0H11DRAFT_1254953 [Mycena galericulata]|nr:hypothetical protein B0H11DRAFT_1254953 [Mycena galericulata]